MEVESHEGGLEKELPTCPVASGGVGYLEFYPMLFAGLVLVLVLAYRRVRR
ncbi:hypothetical protein [Thermococcus peptonophilus]|uniref:hypothetical protein n=1 Tax=Thermococcus peptonophilus TaxID=53952 RepID=UPI000A8A91CF